MSTSARVHFTHHLCVASSVGSLAVSGDRRPSYVLAHDAYKAEYKQTRQRTPEILGCRYAAYKSQAPLFSTDPTAVTCLLCRGEWKANTKRAWERSRWHDAENWISDEELTVRCWYVCCRHRGAPSPFPTPTEERQYLLEKRSRALLDAALRELHVVGLVIDQPMTPRIAAQIAKLPAEDQAALTTLLAEAERVDGVIEMARAGLQKLHDLAHMAALVVQFPKQQRRAA